jgi:site-specific DNA recombinase
MIYKWLFFTHLRGEALRVFIYLRVSTDDQEDNTSLVQQEIDCRNYAGIGNHHVMGVFQDVYTGSVWRERKGFMEMRVRYLAGEAQAVIVRTYSRFTRIIADYYVLTQEMREHSVRLICVKEQYDDSPLGHMLQAIQIGFNEQERQTTRQRTMDGKRARVVNKKLYLAGKKPPYGLKFDDEKVKGKLLINEEEAEVVRDILHMRAQKQTIYAITKYLLDNNIPSPSGGKWNERTVRMIIDRAADLYRGIAYETARIALAATIKTQESPRNNTNTEDALLRSGYIRCGSCGNLMSMRRHKKKDGVYLIYRCPGLARAARTCEHIEISAPKIDKIVWDFLLGVLRDLDIAEAPFTSILELDEFASSEKAAIKTIDECKGLIEQYREDLKRLGLSRGTRTAILEDLSKRTSLLKELEQTLVGIQAGRISFEKVLNEYRDFVAWCQEFKRSGGQDASYKPKREALRFLGASVYIYKKSSLNGQYKIRLAPPELMSTVKLLPKNNEGNLSGD